MNERDKLVNLQEIMQYPFIAAPADILSPYKTYTKEANYGPRRVVALKPNIVKSEEYPKTDIQYFGNHSIDIKVLAGEGFVLLQRQAIDNQGHPLSALVEDFSTIRLRKGDALTIPPHFYIQFVNTGRGINYFTIEDDSPVKVDNKNLLLFPEASTYELIKSEGFAYDVVKGIDGNPALKKNKFYRKEDIKEKFLAGLPIL